MDRIASMEYGKLQWNLKIVINDPQFLMTTIKNYTLLKKQAFLLRKTGLSYGEIREKVPVSKSTLSLWLKDVLLKKEDKERLYGKQIKILSLGPQSQRKRRLREVAQIIQGSKKEIKPLSFETLRLMGAALYWAEGSKGKLFRLTNSDPKLILFIVRWIDMIFKVHPRNLKARLNIYPQQKELDIKKFWSKLTGIPLKNFGKSFIKPDNKKYRKNILYHGTIRIEVPKSVDLQYKTYGWIQGSLKNLIKHPERIKTKWDCPRK